MTEFSPQKTFVGPFVHTNESGELIIAEHGVIRVKNGKITDVIVNPTPEDLQGENVTVLNKGQFLIPGLIDCHIHAVQLPNLGVGYDKELLEWLETYTFPLERKYSDEKYAKEIFNMVVRHTLAQGTTTACYFASLYAKASVILGQEAIRLGQRAFIGKLSMNEKRSDNYYEPNEESLTNLKNFIEELFNLNSPLVKPVVTPRFALSCDMMLMKELGKLAKEKDLHVQTHLSENLNELKAVKEKFSLCPSYTAVYHEAGLLTNKTVVAHGIYLADDEIALLKKHGTAVIHCPSSNTCLKSGLCDVQRLRSKGLKIGLGTDVSGGQNCSILDAMRQALQVSNHLFLLKNSYTPLNYKDVFHLATLGGAIALAIAEKTGSFEVGKEFDALVVDITIGILNNLQTNTLEEQLQKFIYSGDDRNIIEVYVSGQKVK